MDAAPSHTPEKHEPLGSWRSCVLGANVARLRKRAKINKKTFCLMVGIGRPFLNRIESGQANPRLSVLESLAEALETTPQDLLTPPFEPFARPADAVRPDGGIPRSLASRSMSAPQRKAGRSTPGRHRAPARRCRPR